MRTSPRLAPTALVLTALLIAGCGGDSPESAKKAAEPDAETAEGEDIRMVDPAKLLENVKVPEVPEDVAKGIDEVKSLSADDAAASAQKLVGRIEQVAQLLGIQVTDENRQMLAKIAETVQDDATKEQVQAAAAKLGFDTGDLSVDSLKEKLGMGGDDDGEGGEKDDGKPGVPVRTRDPGAVLERAKRRAKLRGKPPRDGTEPAAATDLGGLDKQTLRTRRKAEVTRLETAHDKALAELDTEFEAKKTKQPERAAKIDKNLARRRKELRADYDERIQEVRKRYKKAIEAAKE